MIDLLLVNNNEITISKGDACAIKLNVKSSKPLSGKLVFNVNCQPPIVKELDSDVLLLEKADTENAVAGYYEYDVKMVYENGEQLALIYPTRFVIEEVI